MSSAHQMRRRQRRRGGLRAAVWRILRPEHGSQLVEFAFILPFLAVITVGVIDFAQGFILRQKLTNAAREGARIGAELSPLDIAQPSPPSVDVIRDAVVTYLNNADVNVSGVDTTSTKTGPTEWTYYDNGDAVLVIDRAAIVAATGAIGTQVTVRHSFSWSFSDVIDLLAPSASYAGTFLISTNVIMPNLVN